MNSKIYGSMELERDFGQVTFGRALWAYRKGEEITQKDFASLLGLSVKILRNFEKGRRIPSPGLAAKIARQVGQSERLWIQFVFQDMLREAGLAYTVLVKYDLKPKTNKNLKSGKFTP